jgi:hypothetical protein
MPGIQIAEGGKISQQEDFNAASKVHLGKWQPAKKLNEYLGSFPWML